MTHMFGELVGILKAKNTTSTTAPAATSSSYGYTTQDQHYTGVGGGSQTMYDMSSNNYLQFHEL